MACNSLPATFAHDADPSLVCAKDSTNKDDASFEFGYKLSGSLDKPSQTTLKLKIANFSSGKIQNVTKTSQKRASKKYRGTSVEMNCE